MPNQNVSIYNDVLGPVMRGPSSSHTAASVRIAHVVRALSHGKYKKVQIQYDPNGSLATTAGPQGSDMGLAAGLLGLQCSDARVANSLELIKEAGIHFETVVTAVPEDTHPNTYKIVVDEGVHTVIALSTGGGAITIKTIDGVPINGHGDRFLRLFFFKGSSPEGVLSDLQAKTIKKGWINTKECTTATGCCIVIESSSDISGDDVGILSRDNLIDEVAIPCVMPVPRPGGIQLPFTTTAELQKFMEAGEKPMELWEAALSYESARSGLSQSACLTKAEELIATYQQSLKEAGLEGTDFSDRILGPQAQKFSDNLNKPGTLLDLGLTNEIIKKTTLYMEVKSSFGLIIAGPTAGSCAVVPGSILSLAEARGMDRTEAAKMLLIAGLIGVLIATKSTFAAEEGGCQAECGAAGSMAAAALCWGQGGSSRQCIAAASMTIQSVLGMVCDPIANRVEAPCLYRNINTASMAACSANMALCSFTAVIPYDEVIAAHWEVCKLLPRSLRCTGLGGLAAQPTSRALETKMAAISCGSCSCNGNGVATGDGEFVSLKW